MSNQRIVSGSAIPRSIPTPPEQAIANNSEPDTTSFDANLATATISRDGASATPPTPISLNGDNLAISHHSTPSHHGLAPPTLNNLPHVSLGPVAHPHAHPSSLATALRALNDGPGGAAFRDFPTPSSNDSPYTKSISSTAPASPRIPPVRQNSGSQTPRVRPHATTLSIPGMTRSLISPDGKIADRDVAAKLVIIMVGLPARGKSYITKKLRRYLAWQQHNTRIFNVGKRRRGAAVTSPTLHRREDSMDIPPQAATILVNGAQPPESPVRKKSSPYDQDGPAPKPMDQSAKFFDPNNEQASRLREEIAIDTLNELLDYLISGGGSVGILDATNSTLHRRQNLFNHIKAREPKLGILFIESVCKNPNLLEANMRLKLSGPDYKDKDPVKSLADFKERVKAYESAYVPLGDFEEDHEMQYIKMTDVGKKLTHFGLGGFLSSGIAHYLSSFNLSPRQIWLTRHGQSADNQLGKIGGNSELTDRGHQYSVVLYKFITQKRMEWLVEQKDKVAQSSFPPLPGDQSPPYPDLSRELDEKNFCVWTSMLMRSIQTAQHFEADEDYDVKNWEMLNELNAGKFEGLTYEDIARTHNDEYRKRKMDKLHYVYPGVGGEGYLQVISRLRDMVREIERIKDHVMIIGHRSICRVLMAYFMDLTRDDIADLDMPLGMLYAIEPKPYGIEFHAYKYDEEKEWFNEVPGYKPTRTVDRSA
ncbi:bifunctional 6-phosphofructo-2-kinase/fructose-2,6-bisphosphate 2-phosphatase [Annulohypoxylon maeteangense]|uniref:bifunctional 6-phosphofructo-2-kinase/fructose-2,6-bisphosphate 2-phosphatase n=1 Tax=Annulohypoxylon maeteangense TaxID=1927788 RepID=UPI00200834FF|nr:bifunctional 6-phosphofructo-2-kinase/fructose-2,6-bisphosphate 2-phosphatase [Annulohypoxylon maeteangense]KAI0882484.1 bifunctional 6-phosphofructo-2-kinase/fructose-2,6-bisphosphate 2-phosphatase [Annulohypoxylon maeteangense]